MPTYSNVPPRDPRGNSLTLRRTPTGRPLQAIVTSTDLIGTPTHFWRGRTMPCTLPDCPAHEAGMPWRWHGYLSALNTASHEHFLFEMTAQACEAFVQYRTAYESLRGCLFMARRVNASHNARVHIVTKPADLENIQLPPAPNLVKILAIIWNLATPTIDVSSVLKGVPRIRIDKDGNGEEIETQLPNP